MSAKKVFYLTVIITGLSLSWFHLLAYAQVKEIEIRELVTTTSQTLAELSAQLALIKWAIGVVVGALSAAIAYLFKALIDVNNKLVVTLEKYSEFAVANREAAIRQSEAFKLLKDQVEKHFEKG